METGVTLFMEDYFQSGYASLQSMIKESPILAFSSTLVTGVTSKKVATRPDLVTARQDLVITWHSPVEVSHIYMHMYIYISSLGTIFSLIHVQLNNMAILACTSFFSSFSTYLILQEKLKITSPKFILLFIIRHFT